MLSAVKLSLLVINIVGLTMPGVQCRSVGHRRSSIEKLQQEKMHKKLAVSEKVRCDFASMNLGQLLLLGEKLSKGHSPNSLRHPRDSGYHGPGVCGTFVIFPFLAFLRAALTSSVTLMNTINNTNNNNNTNTNENVNMNVNMNGARSLIKRNSDSTPWRPPHSLQSILPKWLFSDNFTAESLVEQTSSFLSTIPSPSDTLNDIRSNVEDFKLPGLPSIREIRERLDSMKGSPARSRSQLTLTSPRKATGQRSAASTKETATTTTSTEASRPQPPQTRKAEDRKQVNLAGLLGLPAFRSGLKLPEIPSLDDLRRSDSLQGMFNLPKLPSLSDLSESTGLELPTLSDLSPASGFKLPKLKEQLEFAKDFKLPGLPSVGEIGSSLFDPSGPDNRTIEPIDRVSTQSELDEQDGPDQDYVVSNSTAAEEEGAAGSLDTTKKPEIFPNLFDNFHRDVNKFLTTNVSLGNLDKFRLPGLPSIGELKQLTNTQSENNSEKVGAGLETEEVREGLFPDLLGGWMSDENETGTRGGDSSSVLNQTGSLIGNLVESVQSALDDSQNLDASFADSKDEFLGNLTLPNLQDLQNVIENPAEFANNVSSAFKEFFGVDPKQLIDVMSENIRPEVSPKIDERVAASGELISPPQKLRSGLNLTELGVEDDESLPAVDDGHEPPPQAGPQQNNLLGAFLMLRELPVGSLLRRGLSQLSPSNIVSAVSGMVNPSQDLEHLKLVVKIVPRLVPYIIEDYKSRLAGLVTGVTITESQIFEAHKSLVGLHQMLGQIKRQAGLPDSLQDFVALLMDNNLRVLTLLLQLMARAAADKERATALTEHDLEVIDRFTVKPHDVLPSWDNLL